MKTLPLLLALSALPAAAATVSVEESATPTSYSNADFTTIAAADADSFVTSAGAFQSFTAEHTGTVASISVLVLRLGTGDFNLEVYESFDGDGATHTALPSKFRDWTDLWLDPIGTFNFSVASGQDLGSGSPGGALTIQLSGAEQFSITTGATYAVRVTNGATGDYFYQRYEDAGSYADGAFGYSNGAPTGRDNGIAYSLVPEPSIALLGGLGLLGLIRRRRA